MVSSWVGAFLCKTRKCTLHHHHRSHLFIQIYTTCHRYDTFVQQMYTHRSFVLKSIFFYLCTLSPTHSHSFLFHSLPFTSIWSRFKCILGAWRYMHIHCTYIDFFALHFVCHCIVSLFVIVLLGFNCIWRVELGVREMLILFFFVLFLWHCDVFN